jgi:hypothetical protein
VFHGFIFEGITTYKISVYIILCFSATAFHKTLSDDSSSSIGELMLSHDKGLSSLHQVR